ncbi:S-protein homolog 5-like [Mercurialis annua]|uniref:S-protein homolog 5-like n=1 Tax=Mercurialis annua TaxID=3986 RepID=UPI0021606730|nr:S-protein homolog 5-like [Mercurialis annua]
MKYFKKECIVLLMFMFLLSSSDVLGRKRVRVIIINGVNSDNPLSLHCKSGDDDFGGKVLEYNQSFQFSFRPNIFGKTVFRCNFQVNNILWADKYYNLNQTTDVYGGKTDGLKCGSCYWEINQMGLCLGKAFTGPFDYCRYKWIY